MKTGDAAVVIAAALFMTACGSGTSVGANADPMPLAAKIGCSGAHRTSPEMFATNAVECRWHGDFTQIETFAKPSAEDQYWQIGSKFADGTAVKGDGYVVECDNGHDAQQIAAKLGGSVQ